MSEPEQRQPPEDSLASAIGAILFASDEPVRSEDLARALGGVERERVERALEELEAAVDRSGAGLRLEKIAGGFRMATRPDVGEWVRQYFRQRNRTRLSHAALETLAIVAYRQPITAPEIQAIRGKDPSGLLRTLLEKRLLRVLGKKQVVGRPLLYGTSRHFLMHFGLDTLSDLPAIEDFESFVGTLEAGQARLFADDGPENVVEGEGPELPEGGDEEGASAAGPDPGGGADEGDGEPASWNG